MCSDPMSGFTLMSREQQISLPPSCLGNIGQGVKQQLDSKIGLFSDEHDGALIAYSHIKLLSDKGQIIDDSPFIHFKIKADFVIFQPQISSCLKGVVNKISRDHVGIVIHQYFNASVPLVQNGHKEATDWSRGDPCVFTVTKLFMHRNLLSMRGKNIER
ncbi:hypothetical protein BaRGS_00031561 [Batillaria attramentaria]|uniref:DNA-directed RNA polymerase I subunit RPA43 n=1 Tax=Batillaria attramentaria TaxID=370345 RepID=A0ABD0JQK3_9CAEN